LRKEPYSIKIEVKIGIYSVAESSLNTDYLSEGFCEKELYRLKQKITESEKYKEIYKSKMIR
jgi:hypothetical protein